MSAVSESIVKQPDVSADDEIEYRFVKGLGWVAGYRNKTSITRNPDGTYNVTLYFDVPIRYWTIEGTVSV